MRVSQMAASCETDLAHVRPISVPQPAAICDEICRHDFIHVSTFFRFLCQKSGKKTKNKTQKRKENFILCSPSRLPSPQFSGNSSAETQRFHVRCVKNYVHWPVRQERSTWWTICNGLGKGGAEEGRSRHQRSSTGLAQRTERDTTLSEEREGGVERRERKGGRKTGEREERRREAQRGEKRRSCC